MEVLRTTNSCFTTITTCRIDSIKISSPKHHHNYCTARKPTAAEAQGSMPTAAARCHGSYFYDRQSSSQYFRKRKPAICCCWTFILLTLCIFVLCFPNPVVSNRLRHLNRRIAEHDDGGKEHDDFYHDETDDWRHDHHDKEDDQSADNSHLRPHPSFDHTKGDEVNVPWGRNAYLHCAVRNKNSKTKLAWTRLRDGILLTIDNQSFADPSKYIISYIYQEEDYVLIIKNANTADTGVYQCELSTDEPLRRLVKLTVTANEGEMTGTQETNVGGVLAFTCTIQLTPPNTLLPLSLVWYHNDSAIKFADDTGGKARKKSSTRDERKVAETIEIFDIAKEDAGEYRCGPTPDTLGGKMLTAWVEVVEGATGNRLTARNTHQKQEKLSDGRSSSSSGPMNSSNRSCLAIMIAFLIWRFTMIASI